MKIDEGLYSNAISNCMRMLQYDATTDSYIDVNSGLAKLSMFGHA